jgi:hypothetical protein
MRGSSKDLPNIVYRATWQEPAHAFLPMLPSDAAAALRSPCAAALLACWLALGQLLRHGGGGRKRRVQPRHRPPVRPPTAHGIGWAARSLCHAEGREGSGGMDRHDAVRAREGVTDSSITFTMRMRCEPMRARKACGMRCQGSSCEPMWAGKDAPSICLAAGCVVTK